MNWRLYLLMIFLSYSSLSPGEDHIIFDEAVRYYAYTNSELGGFDFRVDAVKVKPGDKLIFETGESIIFQRVLGKGDNTIVIEDDLGRAVRIPLNIQTGVISNYRLNGFEQAMRIINQNIDQGRSTQILQDQFMSKYVLLVEKIEIEINLLNYLESPDLDRSDPKYIDLIIFLDKFRIFSFLDEFYPFQIGWVKDRGWVLFDIGSSALLGVEGFQNDNLESFFLYWSDDISATALDQLKVNLINGTSGSPVNSCRNILISL